MDMFEEARALAVTMKMRKMSQSETAKSLGVSPSYISNKLRLLGLSEKMQKQITENNLTERHARALLRLDDESDRQAVLDRVCKEKLSVARTEALVDLYYIANAPEKIGNAEKLNHIDIFLDDLTKSLSVLSSRGLITSKKISCENEKTFISICIITR